MVLQSGPHIGIPTAVKLSPVRLPCLQRPFNVLVLLMLVLSMGLAGCGKKPTESARTAAPEVSALTVRAREVPMVFEFVGQTESSQQVEIRARVSGFLEKRVYTEGAFVKPGQTMFLMDTKPLHADLLAAQGELAQQQARLSTARANLARVKPLVADNALAVKDLDDATGQAQAAAAAVEAAQAKVTNAKLNLGYATITSPVAGLSSFAKVQDGAYIDAQNSLLTYVAKLDPIRVNFSLSENESLRLRDDMAKGRLHGTARDHYAVELVLADGSSFPTQGRITFADAAFSQDTGTFLLRAELPNPSGVLRPGQFVRVKVHGFTRPASIVIPQRAVQQGPRSAYVWVVDAQNKVAQRPVEAGDWLGDQWLVSQGLKDGDRVVVDGFMRLAPEATVRVKEAAAEPLPALTEAPAAGKTAPETAQESRPASAPPNAQPSPRAATVAQDQDAVYFEPGGARIDATGRARLNRIAATLKSQTTARAEVHGYVDASGDTKRNAELAKARAQAVRDALTIQGVARERIVLRTPENIVGGEAPAFARRVDIVLAGAR